MVPALIHPPSRRHRRTGRRQPRHHLDALASRVARGDGHLLGDARKRGHLDRTAPKLARAGCGDVHRRVQALRRLARAAQEPARSAGASVPGVIRQVTSTPYGPSSDQSDSAKAISNASVAE